MGDQCYCATAKKLPTTAPRKPFPEKLDAADWTQEEAQAVTHYLERAADIPLTVPSKPGRTIPVAGPSLYTIKHDLTVGHAVSPRMTFEGGMQRDSADEKVDWSLVFDGPLLGRYAAHLTKGARHYSPRNWMKAAGPEELARFRESAARHFAAWMAGDTSEDHAAAVVFNLNGYEYVADKMGGQGA